MTPTRNREHAERILAIVEARLQSEEITPAMVDLIDRTLTHVRQAIEAEWAEEHREGATGGFASVVPGLQR